MDIGHTPGRIWRAVRLILNSVVRVQAVSLPAGFTVDKKERADLNIHVRHSASNTSSAQAFRGVAEDHASGSLHSKVLIDKGLAGVSATQSSNNLLLSDRAMIHARPELEIYSDDVKCSHGATVAQVDENEMFYLRTRGFTPIEANNLLLQGFLTQKFIFDRQS